MSTASKSASMGLKFHRDAYCFVDAALRHTQRTLGRTTESPDLDVEEEGAHISGQELLEGIRQLAIKEFGMVTVAVFKHWGITTTEDFGRIVFDFIERGTMRKTDRDQLSDFFDVYDFEQVFIHDYEIDVSNAFRK